MTDIEQIRRPIEAELEEYQLLFRECMSSGDDFIDKALRYIYSRQGKMMRPTLVLLLAKGLGKITENTLRSAVVLELLHTASLIHDDVVDESEERRGHRSVKSVYDNKTAVLMGDYMLSSTLHNAALTGNVHIVEIIAKLGKELTEGEIAQLNHTHESHVSEETYFNIIRHKTAALFTACGELAAITAGADEKGVEKAKFFGETVGICFQIRDDIFDYFDDARIGKPRGNDMREGKLTLPVIHALLKTQDSEMTALAMRVKKQDATNEEIQKLIDFTKENGGIEYAERKMDEIVKEALEVFEYIESQDIKTALKDYLNFVIQRSY